MVSLGQELEKGLAGQFRFSISRELEQQEHGTSGDQPDISLLSYCLGAFPHGLCGWDSPDFLTALWSQSSQTVYTVTEGSKSKRASGRGTGYIAFFDLPQRSSPLCHFLVFCWSKQSQKTTQGKGEEILNHLLMQIVSKSDYLKNVGRKIWLWPSLENAICHP